MSCRGYDEDVKCSKHVEECKKCIKIKNLCIKLVKKTIILGCMLNKRLKFPHQYIHKETWYSTDGKKVEQSRYRPGVAQRVPGSYNRRKDNESNRCLN